MFGRVCVKLLEICEALKDRDLLVIPYFYKAKECFKRLTETSEFTKRVYRKLMVQQIHMGKITDYPREHPTKHLHFKYPQKDLLSTIITYLFPKAEGNIIGLYLI